MYNRVYNHLDFKEFLYEKQFGFQRNDSTEHAILQLTRDITSPFEKGEYTLGVFIDLSKAFDTVDHQILIKKLQYYGIDGTALEWFQSYLATENNTYFPKKYPKLSRYYLWCSARIYATTTSFPDLCE